MLCSPTKKKKKQWRLEPCIDEAVYHQRLLPLKHAFTVNETDINDLIKNGGDLPEMSVISAKRSLILMIYWLLFEKYVVGGGGVGEAFRGTGLQRSAASQGIKQKNTKKQISKPNRGMICRLWHLSKLIIHHAFLPLLLGGSSWDCFSWKREKEHSSSSSSSFPLSPRP